VVYAVINGGYFNMVENISASFLAEHGKVICPNGINSNTKNHPTVGAFGVTAEGHFEAEYIYSYGDQHTTYKFDYPNPFPGPPPIEDQGKHWDVKEGIGAGPILVKKTQIVTANVENFDFKGMIDFRHPRSAICIDSTNNLYFVAIDGRYDGSDGLKMPEIASVMQSLNCYDAMNLDGGGSTLLYANNHIINRPSDATGPRKVVSAILLRDKYKKKANLMTA
jgi:exopolysaccharide biosynthesis protein